jgi:4-methylaminobutanoate oxidase (formaldehyde-forming)
MLNPSGGIEADVTISCLKEDYFRIICPALARAHNKSHILKNITQEINFKDVTDKYVSLGIFGPNSRKFLNNLVGNYFLKEDFSFATGKYLNFFDNKIWFQRLSFIGELGWELYIPIKNSKKIFKKIQNLGKKYNLCYSGMHTLDTLRLEKKFLHWGHDITSENNPIEAGLKFAVSLKKKQDFIGRKSIERIIKEPMKKKLELFSLKDNNKPGTPLLMHDEPIFFKDSIIGYSTSSNYSFNFKKNIFLAYVKADDYIIKRLSIEVGGKKYRLNHEAECMHDPKGTILRN